MRADSIARLEAILAKATADDRDLTDEEAAEWANIRKELHMPNETRTTPAQPEPSTLRRADAPSVITKVREYSLLKAIGMALNDPNVGDCGLEREVTQSLCKHKQYNGVPIPYTSFLKTSAGQSTLTTGAGGALAATDVLLQDLLADVGDAVMRETILGPLGVQVIAIESTQKARIPVKTKHGTPGFVARDSAATVVDLEWDDIEATPHSLAIAARLNRSSLIYTPAMQSLVESDLRASWVDAMNQAYISADGSANSPEGLCDVLQDASRDFTSVLNANISLASVIGFANTNVASYADATGGRRFLVHPNFALAVTASPIWAGGVTPISDGKTLGGYPLVSSFRSVGADDTTPAVYFGDFDSTFVIMFGPALDLLANPFSDTVYLSGGILLRGISDIDFVFRDPRRLAMASDAQTTASVPA